MAFKWRTIPPCYPRSPSTGLAGRLEYHPRPKSSHTCSGNEVSADGILNAREVRKLDYMASQMMLSAMASTGNGCRSSARWWADAPLRGRLPPEGKDLPGPAGSMSHPTLPAKPPLDQSTPPAAPAKTPLSPPTRLIAQSPVPSPPHPAPVRQTGMPPLLAAPRN